MVILIIVVEQKNKENWGESLKSDFLNLIPLEF